MGTSIEDGKALSRVDALQQCPAQTRFISCEPLLGPRPAFDLTGILMEAPMSRRSTSDIDAIVPTVASLLLKILLTDEEETATAFGELGARRVAVERQAEVVERHREAVQALGLDPSHK